MKNRILKFVIFIIFSLCLNAQTTTDSAGLKVPEDRIRSSDEGFAAVEFRRGVQAYYKGAFNEAIMQFEKALSYLPNDNLILDWLGKSYYKAGMEGSALSYWNSALDNGYGGLLLQNKVEIVRERRVTGDSSYKNMRLSEAGSFSGQKEEQLIFSGPISVLPNNDGTFWVVSYTSNELLLLNQNGLIINRVSGPLNGFDRPVDVIRLKDKNLLVSESAGDRLALLDSKGKFIKYIGEKGRSLGQIVGPQYLAQDSLERIYVTDYGNRRVNVFDKDGTPLFFFGNKKSDFDGLKAPTGIAIINESVFIADEVFGCIFEFDRAGNFIRELVEKNTFSKPESIKIWGEDLVVCDKNKILSVDSQTGSVFEYVRTGNAPSRVTVASPDVNGNLLATDIVSNEVYVMSKIQELVGGLFVQIEHVDSSKFPNVTVELKVENRHRQPVVGLQENNFYITENNRPVSHLKYIGSAANNKDADITIIIDNSNDSLLYAEQIEIAVKEIVAKMSPTSVLRVISAGAIPVLEYVGNPDGCRNFSIAALKNKPSDYSAVDLSLRLACNELINGAKKRSIVMISNGEVDFTAFEKYNLSELTCYMSNNSIGFNFIQTVQSAVSDEFNYLLENTTGDSYYVFRPEGLAEIVENIVDAPQGVYQLSYVSTLPTNFGENYLPLETEVYLLNRSGRDESGYFAPLQ